MITKTEITAATLAAAFALLAGPASAQNHGAATTGGRQGKMLWHRAQGPQNRLRGGSGHHLRRHVEDRLLTAVIWK